MSGQDILDLVTNVTKAWTKQRKAEEREQSATLRRRDALVRCRSITLKEAAYRVMKSAYLKASANNTLPAHARQIMYAARGEIQSMTGERLNDQYFTQTLLPDYMNRYPDRTVGWDVVFDARGHFREPHTRVNVPLGTIRVRNYLCNIEAGGGSDLCDGIEENGHEALFPTQGPAKRFSAVLFIEKEGFMPLFEKVKLAERHDIAIMSTKGMSVTAARLLVDRLCVDGVKLLVLHDFDKSGFSIVGTLQRDTRRYAFENNIEVIDLGLRLGDVREYGLELEEVSYGKSNPAYNLRENGATKEEIEFLYHGHSGYLGHHGERVELNAFASDKLIEWITRKLEGQGIQKVIPDDETLELAYRRVVARKHLEDAQREAQEEAEAEATQAVIPQGLSAAVREHLMKHPTEAWDHAVDRLVALRPS